MEDAINVVFSARLKELMSTGINGKRVTQQDLAAETGYTRQAISQYMDGSVLPNIEKLYAFAKLFGVSADYLLGLTDAPTTNKDVRFVCDYTGLSEKAVEVLHYYQYYMAGASPMNETVSALIEEYFERSGLSGLLCRIIEHPAAPYDYVLQKEQIEQISDVFDAVIGCSGLIEPSVDVCGMLNAALRDRLQKDAFAFQQFRIHRKGGEVNV